MKLVIHSNAAWAATGYGNQVGTMAPRLQANGYDVAVSAFYGLNGAVLDWNGIRHYPGVRDSYGNDVVHLHAQNHFGGDPRGGLVMSLIDVWVLNPDVWRGLDACAWVPVDHDPVPPRVTRFFDQSDVIPVAMSRFGQRQLRKYDALYVPHGIDTSILAPRDRHEARKAVGLPEDRFIAGMVAANKGVPSRKSFPEAFRAFAKLREQHPDAILYLHTEATGAIDGINLPNLLASCGVPAENVRWPDQHRLLCIPPDAGHMANLYSAMDVLLAPSRGEGFGIPIIEAQACGTPVIVSDFSAMPEVGKVGWHVSGTPDWTYQDSWQLIPNVDDIASALASSVSMGDRMHEEAREHALGYDADRVISDHFLPALAEVAERCADRKPAELAAA